MAKKDKTTPDDSGKEQQERDPIDEMAKDLIVSLNREMGTRVAFNLAMDDAPVLVKRWISTGSRLLDYRIANRRDGGLPEGRVIELAGLPSIGKSHIALEVAKSTQKMGGIVVYIDTENATSVEKLGEMGIDVTKRFVYCDAHMTEEIFTIMDSTITKAQTLIKTKDIPVLIVWDSVANSSPKQELEGDYDKDTIGVQARAIAKGLRKITGVIGQNNVTLLCLNQLKVRIGVMHGDPYTTPGGNGIPYASSVRIRLAGGGHIEDKDKNKVGINVTATVIKNKVARPFGKCHFSIIFGRGIVEHEDVLDVLRLKSQNGPLTSETNTYSMLGDGGWKTFTVTDVKTGEVVFEKKYTKNSFAEAFADPIASKHIDDMLEIAMVTKTISSLDELADTTSE